MVKDFLTWGSAFHRTTSTGNLLTLDNPPSLGWITPSTVEGEVAVEGKVEGKVVPPLVEGSS